MTGAGLIGTRNNSWLGRLMPERISHLRFARLVRHATLPNEPHP